MILNLSYLHRFFLSPIYCYGNLLDAVQRAGIFNDSKEYVDRPLVADVSEVLDAFSRLPVNVSSSDLREFVLNWTTAAGSDIEPWIPTDWTQRSCSTIEQIANTMMLIIHHWYFFDLFNHQLIFTQILWGNDPFPSIDCLVYNNYLPCMSGRCSL